MNTSTPVTQVSLAEALKRGPPPAGNLAVPIFARGSLTVELYTPSAKTRRSRTRAMKSISSCGAADSFSTASNDTRSKLVHSFSSPPDRFIVLRNSPRISLCGSRFTDRKVERQAIEMSTKAICPSYGVDFLATTAARTGGICMRCLQEGPPQPSRIVKKARKKPTRCVTGFTLESFLPEGRENQESLHSAFYRLACPCGGKSLRILGYNEPAVPNGTVFIPPLTVSCKQCKITIPLFDPNKDGYDAENGSQAPTPSDHRNVTYDCTNCGKQDFETSLSLEYSLDDDELEDCKEMKKRPQDFFTSFNVYGVCKNCRERTHVVSYECA